MISVILTFLMIVVYLAPALVAMRRKHADRNAIILLNIFLGWSFIGWVIALVWSVKQSKSV